MCQARDEKFIRVLSECSHNFCHSLGCKGVVMVVASGGTIIESGEFPDESVSQVE